ncbi:MAG: biopolymer transporter ExbD [Planctomycetales bacterium]|nr:biopolymer transporter ExbD [Planctomycetales bacterium]
MKIPSVHNRQEGVRDVAMTPMIDVVFLLLVFFVWTASFQSVELLLPSRLSVSSESGDNTEVSLEHIDVEQVIIRLLSANDGDDALQWRVNDEPLGNLDQVRQRLAAVAMVRTDIPVIVDPDDSVKLGPVIDVYDSAMQVGFENIQFTTK